MLPAASALSLSIAKRRSLQNFSFHSFFLLPAYLLLCDYDAELFKSLHRFFFRVVVVGANESSPGADALGTSGA